LCIPGKHNECHDGWWWKKKLSSVNKEPDVGNVPTAENSSSSLEEEIKVMEIKSVQSLATNILESPVDWK